MIVKINNMNVDKEILGIILLFIGIFCIAIPLIVGAFILHWIIGWIFIGILIIIIGKLLKDF